MKNNPLSSLKFIILAVVLMAITPSLFAQQDTLTVDGYDIDNSVSLTDADEVMSVTLDVDNYDNVTGAGDPNVFFEIDNVDFNTALWSWVSGGYIQMFIAGDSSLALLPTDSNGITVSDLYNGAAPLNSTSGIILDVTKGEIIIDGNSLSFDGSGNFTAGGETFITTSQTSLSNLDYLEVNNSTDPDPLLVVNGSTETVKVDGRLTVNGYDVLTYTDFTGQDRNLVYNGFGQLGSITNFENFGTYHSRDTEQSLFDGVHDASELVTGSVVIDAERKLYDATSVMGAFSINSTFRKHLYTQQKLVIDPSKEYEASFFIKIDNHDSSGPANSTYFAFQARDRANKTMESWKVTYIMVDEDGDGEDDSPAEARVVTTFDPSAGPNNGSYYEIELEFENQEDYDAWATQITYSSSGLVAWDYLDYVYSDNATQPNYSQKSAHKILGRDTELIAVDANNLRYKLRLDDDASAPGGTALGDLQSKIGLIPQDTRLGICKTGSQYFYLVNNKNLADGNWHYVKTRSFGGGFATNAELHPGGTSQFRYGTYYLIPYLLTNNNQNAGVGGTGVTTYIAGLRVEEVDDGSKEYSEDLTVGGELVVDGQSTLTGLTTMTAAEITDLNVQNIDIDGNMDVRGTATFSETINLGDKVTPFQLTTHAGDIPMGNYGVQP